MLACSFCTSVASPSWWQFEVLPRWHLPVVAVLLIGLGLLLALWASRRLGGRRRLGALLIAFAIGVGIPSAALTVNSARQRVDVVTSRKPIDGDAWRVTCESALQENSDGTRFGQELTTACARATKPWRWAAIATALLSTFMILFGLVLAVSRRPNVAFRL